MFCLLVYWGPSSGLQSQRHKGREASKLITHLLAKQLAGKTLQHIIHMDYWKEGLSSLKAHFVSKNERQQELHDHFTCKIWILYYYIVYNRYIIYINIYKYYVAKAPFFRSFSNKLFFWQQFSTIFYVLLIIGAISS